MSALVRAAAQGAEDRAPRGAGHAHRPAAHAGVPLEVLEACTVWDVPAGRMLPVGGPASDVCYGVRSGMVELAYAQGGGASTLVDVLEPGQWIGADDLLMPHRPGMVAETASACSLHVLRRSRMLQLMESSPAVAAWLLGSASARIHRIAQRLHALTTQTPEQRAQWAIDLVIERFAHEGAQGRAVPVRYTQTQLARLADTSRQKVNQVMVALMREGRLQVIRGRIAVPRAGEGKPPIHAGIVRCPATMPAPTLQTWWRPTQELTVRTAAQ